MKSINCTFLDRCTPNKLIDACRCHRTKRHVSDLSIEVSVIISIHSRIRCAIEQPIPRTSSNDFLQTTISLQRETVSFPEFQVVDYFHDAQLWCMINPTSVVDRTEPILERFTQSIETRSIDHSIRCNQHASSIVQSIDHEHSLAYSNDPKNRQFFSPYHFVISMQLYRHSFISVVSTSISRFETIFLLVLYLTVPQSLFKRHECKSYIDLKLRCISGLDCVCSTVTRERLRFTVPDQLHVVQRPVFSICMFINLS